MGYRSDVAFVIEFGTEEQATKYLNDSFANITDLKQTASSLEIKGKYIVFQEEQTKWYEEYEEVMTLITFYKNSVYAEGFVSYIFKRIGEATDDYEEDYEGEPDWLSIDLVRVLEINI